MKTFSAPGTGVEDDSLRFFVSFNILTRRKSQVITAYGTFVAGVISLSWRSRGLITAYSVSQRLPRLPVYGRIGFDYLSLILDTDEGHLLFFDIGKLPCTESLAGPLVFLQHPVQSEHLYLLKFILKDY